MSRTAPGVDLRPDHWAIVCSILRQHVPDREVLAFGSRATWTAKDYSDLDLAILGDEPLTRDATSALAEGFGESDLPFKVDVVDWAKIDNIFCNIVRRDGVAVQVPRETSKATGPACRSLPTSGESIEEASQLGICAEIVMGQSPPGNTTNTSGDGVPLLNGPTEFGSHHPEPAQFTTDARKMAYPGDLLFCVRGSTTGRMNWADQEYAIGRGIASLRHKRGQQFQPFVQAVVEFSLPDLLNQATGSTFPNVSARQLATIWWPPLKLSEQRAIAHILGTLDDKIELNRRMNETLEAIARALFKSWFVDFDPVRAKMEGRHTGLPQDIADLFPDRLVNSEMGKIPEGWEVFRLDQLANHHTKTTSPSRFSGLEYEHFSIPAYDAGQRPAIELGAAIRSNKTVVLKDAVLLSKLNPRIARVWVPADSTARPQICSTEFLVFTPRSPANRNLLFTLFGDQRFRTLLESLVTGTSNSHQRVPPKALKAREVLTGSPRAFTTFGEVIGGTLARILNNRSEAATLAALRDTLLPKLISGEIRVGDAEMALESVT